MSEKMVANENLPSVTTSGDGSDGKRGGYKDEKSTFVASCVDHMLDLTQFDDDNINELDMEFVIKKTSELLIEKKKKMTTTSRKYIQATRNFGSTLWQESQ